jgi:hypothetical protein
MKLQLTALAFVLGTGLAGAQGTFVYDQQSLGLPDGSVGLNRTPFGQSFTPTLDSIGFIDLQLIGYTDANIVINIHSGSITGTILATSLPTIVPGSGGTTSGIYDFLFSDPVSVTPGTLYFFEPVISNGGFAVTYLLSTGIPGGLSPGYPGGYDIIDGTRFPQDLWFREGVVTSVPEPSSAALWLMGGTAYWHCRKRRMRKLCHENG